MYNVWLLEKAYMSAGFLVQTPHDFKINLWEKKKKKSERVCNAKKRKCHLKVY